jgi:hypothetical protein
LWWSWWLPLSQEGTAATDFGVAVVVVVVDDGVIVIVDVTVIVVVDVLVIVIVVAVVVGAVAHAH